MKTTEIIFEEPNVLLKASTDLESNWETMAKSSAFWLCEDNSNPNSKVNLLFTLNMGKLSAEVNNYLHDHPMYFTYNPGTDGNNGGIKIQLMSIDMSVRRSSYLNLYLKLKLVEASGQPFSLGCSISASVPESFLQIIENREDKSDVVNYYLSLNTSKLEDISISSDFPEYLNWVMSFLVNHFFKQFLPVIPLTPFSLPIRFGNINIPVPSLNTFKLYWMQESNTIAVAQGDITEAPPVVKDSSTLVRKKDALSVAELNVNYLYKQMLFMLNQFFTPEDKLSSYPALQLDFIDRTPYGRFGRTWQYKITKNKNVSSRIMLEVEHNGNKTQIPFDDFTLYLGMDEARNVKLAIKVKYKPMAGSSVDLAVNSRFIISKDPKKQTILIKNEIEHLDAEIPWWVKIFIPNITATFLVLYLYIIINYGPGFIVTNTEQLNRIIRDLANLKIDIPIEQYAFLSEPGYFPPGGDVGKFHNAWLGSFIMPPEQ